LGTSTNLSSGSNPKPPHMWLVQSTGLAMVEDMVAMVEDMVAMVEGAVAVEEGEALL